MSNESIQGGHYSNGGSIIWVPRPLLVNLLEFDGSNPCNTYCPLTRTMGRDKSSKLRGCAYADSLDLIE